MDKEYWEQYYKKHEAPTVPSAFAVSIMSYLEKNKYLLELGCGNGRDSLYFAKNNINVLAIDQADSAIDFIKHNYVGDNLSFVTGDFTSLEKLSIQNYDYIYTRFTLHSITEEEENNVLSNIVNILSEDGLCFIEARSVKDELYGVGENVGRNAYTFDGHYRRFLVFDEIKKKIREKGLIIVHAVEDNNLAIFKNENPIVIRIIAKK